MREQLTFYRSYWEAVKRLKKASDRLSALESILAYALDDEDIERTDAADAIFVLIKPLLDAAARKSKGGKSSASKEEDTDKISASTEEDTVNNIKNNKKNKKKLKNNMLDSSARTRFVPPTLEEVEDYVRQRNSPVNARAFWEFFDAGHWTDSKGEPVRNWKQKLLIWEKHEKPKQKVTTFYDVAEEMQEMRGEFYDL